MVKQHKMYINGEFVPALDGRTLAVYNPATEKAIPKSLVAELMMPNAIYA